MSQLFSLMVVMPMALTFIVGMFWYVLIKVSLSLQYTVLSSFVIWLCILGMFLVTYSVLVSYLIVYRETNPLPTVYRIEEIYGNVNIDSKKRWKLEYLQEAKLFGYSIYTKWHPVTEVYIYSSDSVDRKSTVEFKMVESIKGESLDKFTEVCNRITSRWEYVSDYHAHCVDKYQSAVTGGYCEIKN